jgi:hypothetical protein
MTEHVRNVLPRTAQGHRTSKGGLLSGFASQGGHPDQVPFSRIIDDLDVEDEETVSVERLLLSMMDQGFFCQIREVYGVPQAVKKGIAHIYDS